MAKGTLYMIGNAHIDPVWLWQWPEGREEVLSTCRTALELLDEDESFVFCRSSAATYIWIEEYEPAMLERIAERVREGRWVIVGGWWEQPDCNIPAGESLVRHAVLGKRYFLDRFGVEVTVGYNVDTFGHAAALPAILAGAGQDSYCFFRPGPHEKQLPNSTFRWRAPDGSEVIASRSGGHYNTGPDEIDDTIRRAAAAGTPALCFYGVGNHGGGPTRRNLASIHRLQDHPDLPALVMSGPEPYFSEMRARLAELPVVQEELQYHARGCYSAVSEVKRSNREVEQLLLASERLVAAARLQGIDIAAGADLTSAWERLLFNQFHDIIAGTSVRAAYDDSRADFEEAKALAGRHLRHATHRLAARVDTSGEGQPIVVFNPCVSPRLEVIELDVAFRGSQGEVTLVDDTGQEVPATLMEPRVYTSGRTHGVAFLADLPSLGHRAYRLVNRPPAARYPAVEVSGERMECRRFLLELDPETGWIRSLYDKDHQVELCAGPANRLLVIDDPSDTWSHGIAEYRNEVGAFRAVEPPHVVLASPTHGVLRVRSSFGESTMEQLIVLYQDIPQISFRTHIAWRQHHQVLKAAFPLALQGAVATFETAYGHTVRPAMGDEQPQHRWMDLSGLAGDRPYGVALLNDGCYSCDALGSEMRLTVLRSPIYAFHDPQTTQPGEAYDYTDQGPHRLTYALVPHAGGWRGSEVMGRAEALNAPCRCIVEPPHAGPAPGRMSYVSAEPANVRVEVLKDPYEGEGVILRAYETEGQPAELRLTILGEPVGPLSLGAYAIGTWRLVREEGGWRAQGCDLLERPLVG